MKRDVYERLRYARDMGEEKILLPEKSESRKEEVPESTMAEAAQSPKIETAESPNMEPSDVREEDPAKALEKLAAEVEACEKCKLSGNRNKVVVGQGDPEAEIVFIGEAPGAREDATGIPFVGRAGKLLDKIFAAMGLSRESGIYICNILKCRPPGNRDPKADEVLACKPYLTRQLNILSPKVICCLGRVAAQNLLDTDLPLGKMRGKKHIYRAEGLREPVPVVVTYHPAYLLRNPAGKKPTWEDMKTLLEIAGLPVPEGS